MKVSVALCTYNGERFIREQLESILNQTLKVDEVVLCDDGSTDHTLEIVENIGKACDFEIRVFQNKERKGFKDNFYSAISQCQGDLVFLADQDDVWHPDKVETSVKWFETHPEKNVLFTNAALIDESGTTLGGDLWQRFGFDKRKQRFFDRGFGLDIWLWSNRATGATMAVRRGFVDPERWGLFSDEYHDSIIAMQGLITHSMGFSSEKLMDYRLHGDQVCGADNMPVELYYSPLRPCSEKFLTNAFLERDLERFPAKEQRHVRFVLKRSSFNNRWFGWGSVANLGAYLREYRFWAYKFFFHDWHVSVRHSMKRLLK
ncbi:MAG: glycosyltransferase family 2 protein [Bacteroidales bacterium]|nr:glycosyltransferase family 2 protein [Bacteroidales bacterium]